MQEKNATNDNFSYRLRLAINDSGLKQKELAKKAGVSEITISRYCNGAQTPTHGNMQAIAQVLNRPLSWFYGDSSPLMVPMPPHPQNEDEEVDWKARAMAAEERLERLETILKELFAFARIGR